MKTKMDKLKTAGLLGWTSRQLGEWTISDYKEKMDLLREIDDEIQDKKDQIKSSLKSAKASVKSHRLVDFAIHVGRLNKNLKEIAEVGKEIKKVQEEALLEFEGEHEEEFPDDLGFSADDGKIAQAGAWDDLKRRVSGGDWARRWTAKKLLAKDREKRDKLIERFLKTLDTKVENILHFIGNLRSARRNGEIGEYIEILGKIGREQKEIHGGFKTIYDNHLKDLVQAAYNEAKEKEENRKEQEPAQEETPMQEASPMEYNPGGFPDLVPDNIPDTTKDAPLSSAFFEPQAPAPAPAPASAPAQVPAQENRPLTHEEIVQRLRPSVYHRNPAPPPQATYPGDSYRPAHGRADVEEESPITQRSSGQSSVAPVASEEPAESSQWPDMSPETISKRYTVQEPGQQLFLPLNQAQNLEFLQGLAKLAESKDIYLMAGMIADYSEYVDDETSDKLLALAEKILDA